MSLRSVNSPTRYLRRYSCELRLDVSDGTTAFARDAAFPRTAAGRIYLHVLPVPRLPDWPHHHWNYALRIDPDSSATATDRADATLSIVF